MATAASGDARVMGQKAVTPPLCPGTMVCMSTERTAQRVRVERLRSMSTIYQNLAAGTVLLGGILPTLRYVGTGEQGAFLGTNLALTLVVAGLFVAISHTLLGKAVRLEP